MNDKLGRPLEVGDEVIFATGSRTTRIGKVSSFGKKMVVIKPDEYGAFNRYPDEVLKTGGAVGSEVETIPAEIANTLQHALRTAEGYISPNRLEKASKWINEKF